ncbi:7-carboxy-7-deazaguanine synthase [Venatoribacter cucullus]|uniref:7-carboxy-7-deazaguanine synthase n=1 Tax=Venatoribacter cucullus TaxID=2661630 RepID=A0A9E8FSQ8_9GAMM|nr:7-carboxy-7-deazaguanine synthase [Venatoribacter cucullus]QQD21984.1 7-carboxy-7-deazaguanine synthase [Oceanospirillaceae bacterium ASx5O]QQD24649.1 7-carboxy-7-deazaguanine synthase [Venatoribacter cucullus]UZK04041.1 7-carboxy-7-deazaguanine synthase [Venatoribacter cucullus]
MSAAKTYRVKEAFYTLQGEGAQAGRPAVFCRFSKCNLWNGREDSRAGAICDFCDTDFIGTDGQNGGQYSGTELTALIISLWPDLSAGEPYVVCTGGEPLLQLDEPLIEQLHSAGFSIGVETNGTLPAPAGIDWLCVSPKGASEVVLTECDELKLVYPQTEAPPERFSTFRARHYYLQPLADYRPQLLTSDRIQAANDGLSRNNTAAAVAYCLAHPQWKLSLQTHKLLGID